MLEGEIDHHDRVLLHNAHQQDHPDQRNHGEGRLGHQQRQQAANARRGQGGDDGERMDQAFIENAQHEIDAEQRRQNQQPLAGLKTAEHPGIAGKFAADGAGHLHIQLRLLDQPRRLAQRHAFAQVESDG